MRGTDYSLYSNLRRIYRVLRIDGKSRDHDHMYACGQNAFTGL